MADDDRTAQIPLPLRNSSPLVSVVMPVWNAAAHLEPAIRSVMSQTLPDFELLIVDDGSTDDSAAIAHNMAQSDVRIRVIHQQNAGSAAARNLGLAHAQGTFIALLDADDIALSNRLRRQVGFLTSHPAISAVASYSLIIDRFGKVVSLASHSPVGRDNVLRAHRQGVTPFTHSTVMIRRSALEAVGGYRPAFRTAQDMDLWDRLLVAGFQIDTIPEPLACYRIHETAASTRHLWDQKRNADWMTANIKRRYEGLPPLTREAWASDQLDRPLSVRVKENWGIRVRQARRALWHKDSGKISTRQLWLQMVRHPLEPWHVSVKHLVAFGWRRIIGGTGPGR